MSDPKWTNGRWKESVTLPADLPLQGNSDGDCREVLNPTGAGSAPMSYVWDEDLPGPNKWLPFEGVGLLAGRPSFLPGTHVGYEYFATNQGANGTPLWWNGAAWVTAASVIVP